LDEIESKEAEDRSLGFYSSSSIPCLPAGHLILSSLGLVAATLTPLNPTPFPLQRFLIAADFRLTKSTRQGGKRDKAE
jgi:hypothetical protein